MLQKLSKNTYSTYWKVPWIVYTTYSSLPPVKFVPYILHSRVNVFLIYIKCKVSLLFPPPYRPNLEIITGFKGTPAICELSIEGRGDIPWYIYMVHNNMPWVWFGVRPICCMNSHLGHAYHSLLAIHCFYSTYFALYGGGLIWSVF